jgi:hypothetical protein
VTKYVYINKTFGEKDDWKLVGSGDLRDHEVKEIISSALNRYYGNGWTLSGEQYTFAHWTQYVLATVTDEPMEVLRERAAKEQRDREVENMFTNMKNARAVQDTLNYAVQRGIPYPSMATYEDTEAWGTFVLKNTDFYGKGVVDYADRWAALMEQRIANGEKLADIASETSHAADTNGITGFMYGAAISTLVACKWIHAEDLRRWHNREYGVESDTSIVNPAILTFGGSEE